MANTGYKQATIAYKVSKPNGEPLDINGELTRVSGKKQAIALLEGQINPDPIRYEVERYFTRQEIIGANPTITYNVTSCPVGFIRIIPRRVILDNITRYGQYNGYSSKTKLATRYNINSVGDYFEIRTRFPSYTYTRDLSLLGSDNTPTNYNLFSYAAGQGVVIRDNSGNWITFDKIMTVDELADWHTYRIDLTAEGWRLSMDGEIIKATAKADNLFINNIGNAYVSSFALCDVAYLTIHTSDEGDFYNNTLASYSGSAGVIDRSDNDTATVYLESSSSWELISGPDIATLSLSRGAAGRYMLTLRRTEILGHGTYIFRNNATQELATLYVMNVNSKPWVLENATWNMLGFWYDNGKWKFNK